MRLKIVRMRSLLILFLFHSPPQPFQLTFTIACMHGCLHVPLFTILINLKFTKPFLIVKGYPQIIIKGKPRDPLDLFYNTDSVSHAYPTQNNPQSTIPVSLSPSQPVFPQPPSFTSTFKEYDLVDQLCTTPTKISLWELLQTSLTYREALQEALSTLPASPPNEENIHSILECMHIMLSVPPIVFIYDDLPSLEVHNQYDAFMVVVSINQSIIRRTLIDNRSRLNVCSMDMLKEIKADLTSIQLDNVHIYNIEKITLGIITLPIKWVQLF